MNTLKAASLALVLAALPLIGMACQKSGEGTEGTGTASAGDRCPHDIKKEKCPFCTPSLIEQDGFCGEHGVPEALCYQCRSYLKAAFRAKGDWCAEHNAPESQCVICNPALKEKLKAGAGHGLASSTPGGGGCPHGIDAARCPFCTPSLIESDGFCGGHNVAEALCVKCRPYLKTAFMAKGDWCAEHNTPESQCVICNPGLKKQAGAG